MSMIRKRNLFLVLCCLCSASLFAQRSVVNAEYERLFATAQKYEAQGQWFYAVNAWYDCIESDLTGSREALQRYNQLCSLISSGSDSIWNNLHSEAEQYWSTHFPQVFTETAQGIQNTDSEKGTVDYVIEYEKKWSSRYLTLMAVMDKGQKTRQLLGKKVLIQWPDRSVYPANADGYDNAYVYDGVPSWNNAASAVCVIQLSVVHEDGSLLFNGTPQVAEGRYVFTALPVKFVRLLADHQAWITASAVALRSGTALNSRLNRIPQAEDCFLSGRYRSEVAEREYILTTSLETRIAEAGKDEKETVAQAPALYANPFESYRHSEPVYSIEPELIPVPEPVVQYTPVVTEVEHVVPVVPKLEIAVQPEKEPVAVIPVTVPIEEKEEEPASVTESKPVEVAVFDVAAVEESSVEPEAMEPQVETAVPEVKTAEKVVLTFYAGMSHDRHYDAGLYVGIPVIGSWFLGLNVGLGKSSVLVSADLLVRTGVYSGVGRIMNVDLYGILGRYDNTLLLFGAGVSGKFMAGKLVLGADAWGGYTAKGKMASNVSLSIGTWTDR